MFHVFDKIVFSMAVMRCISSMIEFSAAMLMLKFNRIETAVKINAFLALVGPTVFIIVTSLGLIGLAGKVPFNKIAFIAAGVVLILYGIGKN